MTTQSSRPATGSRGEPDSQLTFPTGFVWGAATAAYQIEGATTAGGRGRSIWDTFSHAPGRVLRGDTGDNAVDHYHRYPDDIALMSQLGLSAYRFSIAWPRVQPTGSGRPSQAGIDFYQHLVDQLLEAGIQPWPTLYHWDLPQPLEDAGGWPHRDTAYRFVDYAAAVFAAIGDRVRHWTTINEPWCAAFLGYASGEHAPGRTEPAAAIRAAHHLLLASGLATTEYRSAWLPSRPDGQIGLAVNLYPVAPASDAEPDLDAARRIDGLQNRLFLDPVLRGSYPDDVVADLAGVTDLAHVRDGDLAAIAARPDQLGVNYYSPYTVSGLPGPPRPAGSSPTASGSPWVGSEHVRFVAAGLPVTGMGWEIDPNGLARVLARVHADYPPVPLYVTENGAAFDDELSGQDDDSDRDGDGTATSAVVHDTERIGYLDGHLRACHRAIAAGVPLRGYFAWSLVDNFEWAWGYTKRFGLVHVDFTTMRRTLKDSAHWYADVIRRGGLPG